MRWMVWLKRGLAACGGVLCLALIIWLLQFLKHTTTAIVILTVADYESEAVPLNAYADGDKSALEALKKAQRAAASVNVKELDSLDKLAQQQSADALILYVNVIGGSAEDGIVLLPQDASVDDPQRLLSLDAVFDGLDALNRELHKLLVLDISRAPIDWRLGQLTPPDFSSLSQRVQEVPNLAMICACHPGEQSWTSPELGPGQSVFGHYLTLGLGGEADRNSNDKVTVSELFAYVQSNCANWVLSNRDEQAQHPMLFPPISELGQRDFDLIRVTGRIALDGGAAETASGWSAVDRLRDDLDRLENASAIARLSPLAARDAGSLVPRIEDALRAGQSELADKLLREARDHVSRLQQISDDPTLAIADYPFLSRNLGRFWRSGARDSAATRAPRGGSFPLPEDLLAEHLRLFRAAYPVSTPLPDEVEQRIVDVRRLAEEAGAVPVGTLPWVRQRVAQADQRRRAMEDRLFQKQIALEEVNRELDAIADEYQAAIDDAQTVEAARRVWETVSVELPALAAWAAWRAGDADQRNRLLQLAAKNEDAFASSATAIEAELASLVSAVDDRQQRLEPEILRLFDQTRRLQRDLDPPGRGRSVGADTFQHLQAVSESVERIATDIRTRLQTVAADLTRQTPESPQPLHRRQIVEALRAPGLPAGIRRRLNEILTSFEQQMAAKTEPTSASDIDRSSPPGQNGLAKAQSDGLWHAFWILQVMTLSGGDDWEPLAEDWRKAASRSEDRQQRLIALGGRIRIAWGQLRGRVAELVSREAEFEDRRQLLVEADRSSRVLHAYDIGQLDPGLNPAMLLRAYDLTQAVLWHADRHLAGFWAAPGEQSNFWFEQAVDESLTCAARMNRESRLGADREITELRKRSDQQAQAVLRVALTSSDRVRFGYVGGRQPCTVSVESPQGDVPLGEAALWLIATRPQAVEIEGNGRAVATTGASSTFELRRPFEDEGGTENCDPLEIQPVVLFRGHQWSSDTNLTVEPCRAPGRLVWIEPASQTGAVEVSGRDQRAVVFVLDCSLSMDQDLDGKQGGMPNKFDIAVNNLSRIIGRMDPTNRAGLVAFGHRVKYTRDAPGQKEFNPRWIEKFGANAIPAATTPWDDFEELVPVDQLKNNRQQFQKWLQDLGPYGNTPLVGAIDLADTKLPPVSGGTVVAITDGEDNEQGAFNIFVKAVQQAITAGRANVFVVGFGIKNTAPLERMAKTLGCDFTNANNAQALVAAITDAIEPRPYSLLTQAAGQVVEQREIGQPIDDLTPGEYLLTFGEFAPLPLEIFGGERLQFTLDHATRRFMRVPAEYKLTAEAVDAEGRSDGPPTFLAYQDFTLEADRARVTLLLSHDNREASVGRPQDVLFEIQPRGSQGKPTSIRQRLLPGASEPIWEIELAGWPERRSAEVRAWWKMSHTLPDVRLSLTEAGQANDLASAKRLKFPLDDLELMLITAVPGNDQLQVSLFLEDFAAASDAQRALVEQIRVEIGSEDVRNQFRPLPIAIASDYSDSDGTKIFDFTIPPGADRSQLVLGITTATSRKRDAIHTGAPLLISR